MWLLSSVEQQTMASKAQDKRIRKEPLLLGTTWEILCVCILTFATYVFAVMNAHLFIIYRPECVCVWENTDIPVQSESTAVIGCVIQHRETTCKHEFTFIGPIMVNQVCVTVPGYLQGDTKPVSFS